MAKAKVKTEREQFEAAIKWVHNSDESWGGCFTLSDGFMITVNANPQTKQRAAKSYIKDILWEHVVDASVRRNVKIFKDSPQNTGNSHQERL